MLKANLEKIRFLISKSAGLSHRSASDITLLAVTKEAAEGLIEEAIGLGLKDFGENRIQDALNKEAAFKKPGINLHFIGHLQTNKARDAVRLFKLIHSIDSIRIIDSVNKEASKIDKIQDVLLEVNTSEEASKFGLKPEEVENFLKETVKFKYVRIKGLMTMAPVVKSSEEARPYFRALKGLFDNLKRINNDFQYLSMGMSQDFEVAIEEGANIVRIGTALFKKN